MITSPPNKKRVAQEPSIARAKVRWRARRGLLENDLLLTRFLDQHEASLNDQEIYLFCELMTLSEHGLQSLLMGKESAQEHQHFFSRFSDDDHLPMLLKKIRAC